MENSLDMQSIRYLNLFAKITQVNTRFFFTYNNTLMFFVPGQLVSKALGKDAENLKEMSRVLGKRIRIVAQPKNIMDVKNFIKSIIHPITFKNLQIEQDKIVVNAGKMNKAALIGRDKRRLNEMQKIIKVFFKKDFEIV